MRVVIFFLYMCFLVLSGDDQVYTGTSHNSIGYSPAQSIEKAQLVGSANGYQDCTVTKNTGSQEEKEYLISVDVEEEDANNYFARKYRLLTQCCLIPSHTFILSYPYNCFKDRLPFSSHLSYKYLTQRVLRI
jgi:hypothetical protein